VPVLTFAVCFAANMPAMKYATKLVRKMRLPNPSDRPALSPNGSVSEVTSAVIKARTVWMIPKIRP